MNYRPRYSKGSLLPLVLIISGVLLAIGAGIVGWRETESLLFTLISAGLPLLLVLTGCGDGRFFNWR